MDLEEINKEDRSHIRLKERVWDHKISLLWIQQKVMDVSDNVTCIENLSNSEEVLKAAEKVIGKISNQTSLIELTDLIFKKVEKTEEREALLSMIRIGSEI